MSVRRVFPVGVAIVFALAAAGCGGTSASAGPSTAPSVAPPSGGGDFATSAKLVGDAADQRRRCGPDDGIDQRAPAVHDGQHRGQHPDRVRDWPRNHAGQDRRGRRPPTATARSRSSRPSSTGSRRPRSRPRSRRSQRASIPMSRWPARRSAASPSRPPPTGLPDRPRSSLTSPATRCTSSSRPIRARRGRAEPAPLMGRSLDRPLREAWIVEAVRTPVGRYGGALAGPAGRPRRAVFEPSSIAPGSTRARRGRDPGRANQAGEDNRNVARMAVLLAGLPGRGRPGRPSTGCADRGSRRSTPRRTRSRSATGTCSSPAASSR